MILLHGCGARLIHPLASVKPLLVQFASIAQRCPIPLNIFVCVTRAYADKDVFAEHFLPRGMTITAGRPNIENLLDSIIDSAVYGKAIGKINGKTEGLIVGVCGPPGLADSVSQAIGLLDENLRDQMGGVELYEDVFGW